MILVIKHTRDFFPTGSVDTLLRGTSEWCIAFCCFKKGMENNFLELCKTTFDSIHEN